MSALVGTLVFVALVVVLALGLFALAAVVGAFLGRRDAEQLPPNNRTVGRSDQW